MKNVKQLKREAMTEFERGYVAGLIVGEGCWSGDRRNGWLSVKVHARDPEPLRALRRLHGGRINGPYHHAARHFIVWRLDGLALQRQLAFFDVLFPPSRKREQYFAWKMKYGYQTDAPLPLPRKGYGRAAQAEHRALFHAARAVEKTIVEELKETTEGATTASEQTEAEQAAGAGEGRPLGGMTEFERGYVAGLLVAEGSWTGDKTRGCLAVKMHAHDPEPIDALRRLLGGATYGPYEHDGRRYPYWRLDGPDLVYHLPFFDDLLPPSHKREQYLAWKEKYGLETVAGRGINMAQIRRMRCR
jgi:hypothetical protein